MQDLEVPATAAGERLDRFLAGLLDSRPRAQRLIDAGRVRGGGGTVPRLDRGPSGLLVVAKSDDVHRALKAALSARGIEREYLALVEGRPPARSGTIDAPIGRDRRRRERVSTKSDAPREATTDFVVERALPHSTLLRVRLRTGRTHQIRVHFEAIGHPVVGDPVYGGREAYGLERQFLHAARLAFDHPVSGARVDVASPLPADLVAALARASRPCPARRTSVDAGIATRPTGSSTTHDKGERQWLR